MTRVLTIAYLHAREDFDPFTDDPDSLCCDAELERYAESSVVPESCTLCGHRFTLSEMEDIELEFQRAATDQEAA